MKRIVLLLLCICMSSMLWAKDYLLVIDFTDGTDISHSRLLKSLYSLLLTKGSASVWRTRIQSSSCRMSWISTSRKIPRLSVRHVWMKTSLSHGEGMTSSWFQISIPTPGFVFMASMAQCIQTASMPMETTLKYPSLPFPRASIYLTSTISEPSK